MQSKIEQFMQSISDVNTDYKIITDNIIVNEIKKTVRDLSNSWSDTCHSDTHFENDHVDSHTDSHPDCAHANELLGNFQE